MKLNWDAIRDGFDWRCAQFTAWLDRPDPSLNVGSNGGGAAQRSGFWNWIEQHPDPYGALLEIRRHHLYRPYLGVDGDNFELILADAESAVLALGPSGGGKTSGLMVQNIAVAPAAVVSTTSKTDSALATISLRSRVGTCWHFSPTGPAPFGLKELRWSPLSGCKDYSVATRSGHRWTTYDSLGAAARANDGGQNPFFRRAAGELLGVLFKYASDSDRDMGFVRDILTAKRFEDECLPIVKDLERTQASGDEGAGRAARALDGILRSYAGERSGVFASAAMYTEPYATEEALASQRNPNFDPDVFVRGDPDKRLDIKMMGHPSLASMSIHPWMTGSYDTMYITTGDAESNTMAITLDVVLAVRDATYRYFRQSEIQGRERPLPTTFVLDELAKCPIPDLNQMLADARDKGLILIGGIQSLAQAVEFYGTIGRDFLSMWRSVVAFRGIKDRETLELLSLLAGEYWLEMDAQSQGRNPGGGLEWTSSRNWQRRPRLTPDQIAQGHPHWRDGALLVRPNARHQWIDANPYYRDHPWPQFLLSAAEHAYAAGLRVPLPQLAKDHDYRYLDALGLTERFKALEDFTPEQ